MNLNELKAIIDKRVDAGDGELLVVYGDCNGYTRAGYAGPGHVEDTDEYIMEPSADGAVVFMVEE